MSEEHSEKSALVPRLRFPEFRREGGGWNEWRLEDALQISATYGIVKAGEFQKEGIPMLRGGDIKDGRIGDRLPLVTNEIHSQYKRTILQRNDVVIALVGYPGEAAVIPLHYVGANISRAVGLLRPKEGLSAVYLVSFLNSPIGRKTVLKPGAGSAQVVVNLSYLNELTIPVPDTAEQQKIADCLSSLDELITAETQKLDALKTHKKGLMQQLFPREGETAPRMRFPEFREAGEWEEVTLGEIAEIKLGKMLDSNKHTTGNLLPYLNNLAVRWNEVDTSNLPKMYFDDDELDRFGLRAGDVVVCEGGEPGRSAVWDGRLPDLKFQKAVHRVRFKVPFEPRLLVLYLESIAGTPQLEHLFTGGGIKHLTQEVFARLKIPFTCHAEQQRISSCLASLDDLITAQSQKIDALKTHKRGLMQQLFPSMEESL